MVNYFEWSMEYKNTADSIQDVIDRLKAEKRGKSEINKKELDLKIAKYKIHSVNLLKQMRAIHKQRTYLTYVTNIMPKSCNFSFA